jgi:hypothetical protein
MKGGVRVNNCVPAESVNEMDKSQTPPGRDGSNDPNAGKKEYTAKTITPKKVVKHAEKILNKELNKKQGVAETMSTFSAKASTRNSGSGEFRGVSIPSDMKHPEWREPTWSFQEIAQKLGIPVATLNLLAFNRIGGFPEALSGLSARHGSKKYYKQSEIKRWVNANNVREKLKQGVAEGLDNKVAKHNAAVAKLPGGQAHRSNHPDILHTAPKGYSFSVSHKLVPDEQGVAEGGVLGFMTQDRPRIKKTTPLSTMRKEFEKEKTADMPNYVLGKDLPKNPQHVKTVRAAEDRNPEYDDEAGMADNNLETLKRTVEGIDDLIDSGDNLPEWCQEKIAVAKSMLVAVWDYMYSEEASDEVDPEVDEMFEAMDQLAEEMAVKNGVSADLVWEQFEALPDNVLYETAAWRRKEGKSKKGGLNAKGVASYRRENPGSKLQMAVTTKPSKLKPGSKAAKRRKSFCARMSGVKGPMKKPNGKPTRKALALRKWNC